MIRSGTAIRTRLAGIRRSCRRAATADPNPPRSVSFFHRHQKLFFRRQAADQFFVERFCEAGVNDRCMNSPGSFQMLGRLESAG